MTSKELAVLAPMMAANLGLACTLIERNIPEFTAQAVECIRSVREILNKEIADAP